MPLIPKPIAPPDLMPWIRWVQDEITAVRLEVTRQNQADANVNSSQNSTMTMLVERLGTVQAMMESISSGLTLDASQTVSGIFNLARIPALDAGRIPSLDASKIASGTLTRPVSTSGDVSASGHGTFNAAWNYDVSAVTRRAVWMDASGRMGQTASSERFKKDIQSWTPGEQAILALDVVRFHWRPEIDDSEHWEYGLIAEDLDKIGLKWLVSYEEDGVTPHSIHYERLAVALIPMIQTLAADRDAHADRLRAIEERLDALEESD